MDLGFDPTVMLSRLLGPLQILFINLLLSADNALVIALACRGLPLEERRQATLFGIVGAIFLRIAMGGVALYLLRVTLLHIVAGAILLGIAVNLSLQRDHEIVPEAQEEAPSDAEHAAKRDRARFLGAIWSIIIADTMMSFDNVIAIAAVAQDSLVYLSFGLLMSVPMLVWGSALIHELLDGNGYLILASGAFLGWIAGAIAVADPIVAAPIAAYAPFLPIAVPLACAIFVIWQSVILSSRRSGGLIAD
jgi:YjbE family integral membrane protein